MDTLYLEPTAWDLALDASANIALASNPYSLAQDAASAIKTFIGDVYYNTQLGIPYWSEILGENPPVELMRAQFEAAALTVPGVVAAVVFFISVIDRTVTGQVQVTDVEGNITAIGF